MTFHGLVTDLHRGVGHEGMLLRRAHTDKPRTCWTQPATMQRALPPGSPPVCYARSSVSPGRTVARVRSNTVALSTPRPGWSGWHLVSHRDREVRVNGHRFTFAVGEAQKEGPDRPAVGRGPRSGPKRALGPETGFSVPADTVGSCRVVTGRPDDVRVLLR